MWLNESLKTKSYTEILKGIDKSNKNFALTVLFSKAPESMYLAIQIKKGHLLRRSVEWVDMGMLISPDLTDSLPTPHIDIPIEDLAALPKEYENSYVFIPKIYQNIRNRAPLLGLPNKLKDPEKFEAAYKRIEKNAQLIAIALSELKEQYLKENKEELSKERLECLKMIHLRLDGIAPSILWDKVYSRFRISSLQ